MYTRHWLVLGLLAAGLLAAQETQPAIEVTGAVKQPLTLSAEDLAKMPRATVRTTNRGMETVYEGVWLHEILTRAGVPQGTALRGKALTTCVLVEAQDGYQVLFSLGELAGTADGKPLLGAQGRFRLVAPLVAPKDKPGARSVRMVARLEAVQVRK